MSTFEEDRHDLRYAEYVLGVLDADARAAVAREVIDNAEAATAVLRWQRHLVPLAETVAEATPPGDAWARITQRLQWQTEGAGQVRHSWLDNLRLWQWIGVGASVLAAACFALLLRTQTARVPYATMQALMVASIAQTNGIVGWTATVDTSRRQMVLVPATPSAYAKDRSTQLWLIPAGGKPISLGVFQPYNANIITLDAHLLSLLKTNAALAVSLEPLGGSPTGQPTGNVVGQGHIRTT